MFIIAAVKTSNPALSASKCDSRLPDSVDSCILGPRLLNEIRDFHGEKSVDLGLMCCPVILSLVTIVSKGLTAIIFCVRHHVSRPLSVGSWVIVGATWEQPYHKPALHCTVRSLMKLKGTGWVDFIVLAERYLSGIGKTWVMQFQPRSDICVQLYQWTRCYLHGKKKARNGSCQDDIFISCVVFVQLFGLNVRKTLEFSHMFSCAYIVLLHYSCENLRVHNAEWPLGAPISNSVDTFYLNNFCDSLRSPVLLG
jgi:hypothetical protein